MIRPSCKSLLPTRRRAGAVAPVPLILLVLLPLVFSPGCGHRSVPSEPEDNAAQQFAALPIVEAVNLADGPRVVLRSAGDFRHLCLRDESDHLLGRRNRETGEWVEFAFVEDGVFYVLPAGGFRSPADRVESEEMGIEHAEAYYELRRRGFPNERHRSYFVE